MSENIPESIPTSADPRSKRPVKKRALTPRTGQADAVDALFAKPDREIHIPSTTVSKKGPSAPPEIVANVQGSSAGAGSGEFHVYKASRRREYERLRMMDEEVQKEENQKAFEEKRKELEKKDAEKTEKNRLKREKARARKMKGKKGKEGSERDEEANLGSENGKIKKKLTPNSAVPKTNEDEEEALNGGEVKNSENNGLVIQDDED